MSKLTSIDLFAGAGGLTEGFKYAGFQSLYANDFEKNAAATCKLNHHSTIVSNDDITSLCARKVREDLNLGKGDLDILVGGPPCQGFSTYGQRDEDDPRNKLYLQFIKFLEEFRPKSFAIENVAGLLSMSKGFVVEEITRCLESIGYGVDVYLLNAVNYGVPQNRKRVFIVGGDDNQRVKKPAETHSEKNDITSQMTVFSEEKKHPYLTVEDAISDLANINVVTPKQTQEHLSYGNIIPVTPYQNEMRKHENILYHHSVKQMLGIRRLRLAMMRPGDYGKEISSRVQREGLPYEVIDKILTGGAGIRDYKGCRKQDIEKEVKLRELLHEGHHDISDVLNSLDPGGFSNKYRRLHWDEPSHTLVAHMARDCSDFVHPDQDRFISVREAARLQSFHDGYIFSGSQFQQFKQIGNAVPPKLAQAVAQSIKDSLGFS